MMSCKSMCTGHKIAFTLLVIGGLNWGLVGLFKWNLVEAILGGAPAIERIVYILVGLSALMMLCYAKCKGCMPKASGSQGSM